MRNNFRKIYQNLRENYTRNGWEIDESRLRRQAWVLNDRMIFEANLNNTTSSSAGSGGGRLPITPVILNLRLTFDDISNVQGVIGDPSDVSAWNTYFELPTYGNEFTSVTVDGNIVQLSGGSNITLKESLFDQGDQFGTYLLEVDDSGCVVELEYNAFGADDYGDGCPNLTSVSLPNAITIGDYAFYNCTSVTTIDLPSAITTDEESFGRCESLITINLPNVTNIGYSAFSRCYALATIDLPNVITIENFAFQYCSPSLTTINLPVCTHLGDTIGNDNVFSQILGNTISITIPEALLLDGDLIALSLDNTLTVNGNPYQPFTGFSGDLELEFDDILNVPVDDASSVSDWNDFFDLPSWSTQFTAVIVDGNTVTLEGGENIIIRESKFESDSSIVSLVDVGCVAYVDNNAFYNCTALTTVDLPLATSIGDNAFYDCTVLTTVDLPLATNIGVSVFYNCTSLTTADLPNATTIGEEAFANCTSLTTVNLPSATTTGNEAFRDCTSLTTIDLPSAITLGGSSTFAYCTSLTTVGLPSAISISGQSTFENCTSLTTLDLSVCVYLGESTGDNSIFQGISGNTISITIPNSLLQDGDLIQLSLNNTLTVNDNPYQPFTGLSGNLELEFDDILNVPVADASSVSDWNTFFDLPSWSTEFTAVTVDGNTVTLEGGENVIIRQSKFKNDISIISVVDTGCVAYVDRNAFQYCSVLTTINLPSVITIGNSAFVGCTSFSTIDLPVCTDLGGTNDNDNVFFDISGNTITLTVPSALMTADSGNPDGDIVYLQDNNTVTVVTV